MKQGLSFRTLLIVILFTVSACNIRSPETAKTPTTEQEGIATSKPPLVATAKPIPSATVTVLPTLEIATATATDAILPPTPTTVPTATSAFFEYVVQEDDTMFYVIQLPEHGYGYDPEVAATVVALNDNISHIDLLPPVGNTIFIPRPTSTATAVGASATQEVLATIGVDDGTGALLQSGSNVGCYEVEPGDSIVAIAEQYSTTLEILSQLNKEIQFFGCAFTEPSGGPDCKPNIQIGQCVFVPLPTPLPSKTPTPTGDETATPTATHLPPRLIYPADGALIPAGELRLQWVGISGIGAEDEYLVELIDQTANDSLPQVSNANDLIVPSAFAPDDGQTHVIQWRVSVAGSNDQGVHYIVGAPGIWRTFMWTSR